MTGMIPFKTKKYKGLVAVLALTLVVVVAAGALVAGCGSGDSTETTAGVTDTTTAPLTADLNGAGATFPQPVYVEWIGGFQTANPGVTVNYQGVGSGAGIEQFTAQTVDFGASDAYMKAEEITAAEAARPGAKVLHVPTVFGAIVLAYNLPGVDSLKLDSDTVAGIFLGTISTWNDPAIVALNPGVTLPGDTIETVHRSDSSGTTNGFTGYLTSVNAAWEAGPGKGKEITWPVGVGGKGNEGVAAVVLQTKGSIGYVELSYAVQNNMTMAQMKNKSGSFITPSLESTSAAAEGIEIPADLNLKVSDSANAAAYPIVSVTYILAYDKMPDASKAEALRSFLTWSLGDDGTAIATELGYAPLPAALKEAALAKVALIGQ
jgi:phosphate transport system substrate-binding protein